MFARRLPPFAPTDREFVRGSVHFAGHLNLLLCSASNHQVPLINARDRLGDGLECGAGQLSLLTSLPGLVGAGQQGIHRLTGLSAGVHQTAAVTLPSALTSGDRTDCRSQINPSTREG